MDPIIVIKDLHKYFGSVEAVRGVSLEVHRGEVVIIIGPSGSGKSTLLRCINHLETPTRGEVWVDGKHLTHKQTDINAIRAEVGMVFQLFNLFPHLTALGNVALALQIVRKRSREEAESVAMEQLTRVGIPEKADCHPGQLSGGQQQRVAIARALAMNPKIMLFDEPTSALDPGLVDEVLEVMRELDREGITQLVVTHEMRFARDVADKIAFMSEGMIVEEGDPGKIFSNPEDSRTRQFLKRYL